MTLVVTGEVEEEGGGEGGRQMVKEKHSREKQTGRQKSNVFGKTPTHTRLLIFHARVGGMQGWTGSPCGLVQGLNVIFSYIL